MQIIKQIALLAIVAFLVIRFIFPFMIGLLGFLLGLVINVAILIGIYYIATSTQIGRDTVNMVKSWFN